MRLAPAPSSGSCALLASQSRSSVRVSWLGRLTFALKYRRLHDRLVDERYETTQIGVVRLLWPPPIVGGMTKGARVTGSPGDDFIRDQPQRATRVDLENPVVAEHLYELYAR